MRWEVLELLDSIFTKTTKNKQQAVSQVFGELSPTKKIIIWMYKMNTYRRPKTQVL